MPTSTRRQANIRERDQPEEYVATPTPVTTSEPLMAEQDDANTAGVVNMEIEELDLDDEESEEGTTI